MQKILGCVILCLVIGFPTSCLGETVTIDKTLFLRMKAAIQDLNKIENAEPVVTLGELKVWEDKDGRVFVTDQVKCDVEVSRLKFHGSVKTNAKVEVMPRKEKILAISRFGIATVAEQKEHILSKDFDKNSVYLTYRVLKFRKLGLEVIGNFRRFGTGLSYKITPNTYALAGINYKYMEAIKGNTKGFCGIGFKF